MVCFLVMPPAGRRSLRPGVTWLDERDRRLRAAPEQRVQLVTESGETIASTSEKDVSKQRITLS